MSFATATLVPEGGGDPIPLARQILTVGRRESCDICLKFPNISSLHCEFFYKNGYWSVKDIGSTNGIKINGQRTTQTALRPGDEIAIANRKYKIHYTLADGAESALEQTLEKNDDFMSIPLMERAGLTKARQSNRDSD
ncbi:FHA domain-containing protein [Telmatocola sphagniphila]|jgi:adenylate cyclase|uniref:FHA domain-containing protein n=1 Tax=Telmatocola sphagniphila TaxID=1123043 RepID=A0A8E6B9X2_9BACT|nr:FHA domain-containing protein [Telmatocola sphagniphila]QVL34498.1 FHA domain-containing protein [Telmatocola sphagniphila]